MGDEQQREPTPEPDGESRLQVDPDAPPAKPNADAPVVEDAPMKDQGDPLDQER